MNKLLFYVLVLCTGCTSAPYLVRDEVLDSRIRDISGNCYLLAIEVQRRMSENGRNWHVVTLQKGDISHAAACGDGICVDNGLISPTPFPENRLNISGWAIVNIEKFVR